MLRPFFPRLLLILFITLCYAGSVHACSMYKITVHGKTMVGNNEDSWRQTSGIWFRPGSPGCAGVACVGYYEKDLPEGAVNEYGLVFDGFSMYNKANLPPKDPHKPDFVYGDLITIMQQCRTADDVYAFLEKRNLHLMNGSPLFHGGMFMFVDKSGRYLVAEADHLTLGSDPEFVLANFSVCDTKDPRTIKLERYRKGVAFLQKRPADTSIAFCMALSDTMSVNRAKAGDGTLYTTIYDLEDGIIYAYFFHDFSRRIVFNLKDELAKGSHGFRFAELFPGNKGYERFTHYLTPQNNRNIKLFMLSSLFVLLVSFFIFSVSFQRKSAQHRFRYLKLLLSMLCLFSVIFSLMLLTNQAIFYFPSPYKDDHSLLITLFSYFPHLLAVLIIPISVWTVKIAVKRYWNAAVTWLLLFNILIFMAFIGLFAYWKLFGIFM